MVPLTAGFWQEIGKPSVLSFSPAFPITSRIYCCWETVAGTFTGHLVLLISYSSKCYVFPGFYLILSLLFHPLLTPLQFLQLPSCDLAPLFCATDFKSCLAECSFNCSEGKIDLCRWKPGSSAVHQSGLCKIATRGITWLGLEMPGHDGKDSCQPEKCPLEPPLCFNQSRLVLLHFVDMHLRGPKWIQRQRPKASFCYFRR